MKNFSAILLIGALWLQSTTFAAETEQSSPPNPWLSGALGAVIPGAGYAYNGEWGKAALGLTTSFGMLHPQFDHPTTNRGRTLMANEFLLSRNIYGYTVYDSFQTALDLNGRPKLIVDNPHYSMLDLISAPYRPSLYAPKKVWIPLAVLAGMMGLAIVGARSQPNANKLEASRVLWGIPLIAAATTIVGAGEEAEFRGYYFPAFSELTGSAWAGGFLSSALFGFQHTQWTGTGFPVGSGAVIRELNPGYEKPEFKTQDVTKFVATFLGGLHHAWVCKTEGLLNSTAMHAAWDFIIIGGVLLINNDAPPVIFSMNF